ncbi:MAG TPA: 2'-5' RNA ligase family protein [Bryobacteraceae bacterium]|nr:2'-5' RNA ligase family protein [Bryobacteraceae bacterium]
MSSDRNGAHRRVPAEDRLNVFALVIYIPDPLGRFLDDLRKELVPPYNPHAHVSVLPPRPLLVDWRLASEQLRGLTDNWAPFEIALTEVNIFPRTKVIYIELGRGASELRRMHGAMETGALTFEEPYEYHPHVTLAQEIEGQDVEALAERAARRWREYRGPRSFRAERAVFVQNTLQNCWIDLAEYSLGVVPVP